MHVAKLLLLKIRKLRSPYVPRAKVPYTLLGTLLPWKGVPTYVTKKSFPVNNLLLETPVATRRFLSLK